MCPSLMVIDVAKPHSDMSLKTGRDCWHFT